MYILSFDVGIRNLAYVIIKINDDSSEPSDQKEHTIEDWAVLELCDKDVKAAHANNVTIGKNMMNQLDPILEKYKFSYVIIENQIGKNAIKMKTVQNMINMYFVMREYDESNIVNYNAINKLKRYKGDTKTYAQRKKLSKEITLMLCEKYYGDAMLCYFKSYKKKDDLADCLLQCIDYMYKIKIIDDKFKGLDILC